MNISVLIEFSPKTSFFILILMKSPQSHPPRTGIRIASARRPQCTSTTHDSTEKYRQLTHFIILIPTPEFPPLLYVRCKTGVTLYGDVPVMVICDLVKNMKIRNTGVGDKTQSVVAVHSFNQPYEPRRERTGLRGHRPGMTQTGLYSRRR